MRALIIAALIAMSASAYLQSDAYAQSDNDHKPMSAPTFKGLALRSIGPAFMSGRIADIDIAPDDPSTWYVGVGSGGVWKTVNAGTTWTPLFDDQPVYSIGAVALEPGNSDVVWVGTGENVGGRHASWGDGIYRSENGGRTWEKRGLEDSEHISEILIHPDDPDTLWVAAQGPLWSKGGQRGLYKTTDGGENWENVLSAGPWTGVTDVVMDPRNPDRLYAATWQHHRTVAAYMGGGPETAIYRTEDGGESWTKLEEGLPEEYMGKIGLAISPMKPDVIYAAIELKRRTGGIWKSTNRGGSWEKQSDAVGAGTGPHYYQELYASPHEFDRIYMVSNTSLVSDDGGKTTRPLNNEHKHVDDHAIAFRADDPDYILFGSDGGLYESHDGEKTWRFIDNLPITQFYKLAVDDAEPFYNVYGGTQDNNTQGGPSRTDDINGILNMDWRVVLFADGHEPATEPGNPSVVYAQWQQGNLTRTDQVTGEITYIQPQAAPDEPPERYNWDAPILVSSHDPARIYHGSQRLWRSDDRGDSWQALSGDLTRNETRMELPLMDRQWSWDSPWDVYAMSKYNTITSIAESPLDENILYVGTDDGLFQVSNDGGETWTEMEVGDLSGVPDRAYVNDIKADLYDPDTVYMALDAHKYGDYTPYLFKSTNRGRSWDRITDGFPDGHVVWRVVQDHENPDLLFAGTEFGLFFTVDGGGEWIELNGGVSTISFRDLAIQRRENDLVAASFGRSFYILDDYAPLRGVSEDALEGNEALLFAPSRRAWWYIERRRLGTSEGGSQGHSLFRGENPPYGATFTYYLKEDLQSLKDRRQEREKPLREEQDDVPFPGFDALERERREIGPEIWLTVRDADGNVVRRLSGPTEKGFHRVTWDLRYPGKGAVGTPDDYFSDADAGPRVAPGDYTVTLSKRVRGETTELAAAKPFTVTKLRERGLKGADAQVVADFWQQVADLDRDISAAELKIEQLEGKAKSLKAALDRTRSYPAALDDRYRVIRTEIYELDEALTGNKAMGEVGELHRKTITERLSTVEIGTRMSTYGPTESHRIEIERVRDMFDDVWTRLQTLTDETIPAFEAAIVEAGGPWPVGEPKEDEDG